MPQERLIRAHVNIEVKPHFTAGYAAVVRNISLSGCLLSTGVRLKQSQLVPLAIPVEGGGELHVTGTVVRHQGGGPGEWDEYGVSFDALTGEERQALALLDAEGVECPPAARRESRPGT